MARNAAALATYVGDPYMHDPDLRLRLSEIVHPVRLVWGISDRVVSPAYGRAYADAIPGAELIVLDGAGHLPQVEQPARTRDLVWEFAVEHLGRSRGRGPRGGS
jgi:pimeloyl-ACP methyl ester carboxylesterase